MGERRSGKEIDERERECRGCRERIRLKGGERVSRM